MGKLGEIGWEAPQNSHVVKMLDDVQGTNCAEWRCSCGEEWISSGLHKCPKDPLNTDKGIASQDMPLRSDSASDYEQHINAKPNYKPLTHAEIDFLLRASPEELSELEAGRKALLAAFPNGMPDVDSSCAGVDSSRECNSDKDQIFEFMDRLIGIETNSDCREGMNELCDVVRPIVEKLVQDCIRLEKLKERNYKAYLEEFDRVEKYALELREEKAKCDAMRELLAVMHRDGGHYTDEHGVKKSTEVAIAEYYAMREVVEYARKLSKWIEVQRIAWRPTRDDISKEAITIVDGLGESIEKLDVLKGGHWMKRSKYKPLTIAEFREMLDKFLVEPERALSVLYFKIKVRRHHSDGQTESLRIEDKQ